MVINFLDSWSPTNPSNTNFGRKRNVAELNNATLETKSEWHRNDQ